MCGVVLGQDCLTRHRPIQKILDCRRPVETEKRAENFPVGRMAQRVRQVTTRERPGLLPQAGMMKREQLLPEPALDASGDGPDLLVFFPAGNGGNRREGKRRVIRAIEFLGQACALQLRFQKEQQVARKGPGPETVVDFRNGAVHVRNLVHLEHPGRGAQEICAHGGKIVEPGGTEGKVD